MEYYFLSFIRYSAKGNPIMRGIAIKGKHPFTFIQGLQDTGVSESNSWSYEILSFQKITEFEYNLYKNTAPSKIV